MARKRRWLAWAVTFFCACSAAVPALPVRKAGPEPAVLVIRPSGYQPIELSREEYKQGMRMLWAHGPLPGVPRGGAPLLVLTSADQAQILKAAGYLQFCEHATGERKDCWEVLNAGGLDDSGARDVALRFAFTEALQDAASAVSSMTPDQVRAILGLALVGSIVQLLSPDPVTKILFITITANLIACVGVDLFNNLVKGYLAMADELKVARTFADVRAAGERYGTRLGPTLARIVFMVATYGLAKFAGLFKGGADTLPGGQRAAALAEAQGFRIPAVEGARSISLATDGSVVIALGAAAAMASTKEPGKSSDSTGTETPPATKSANPAYEEALAGGRHAGTLRNYARRSIAEIRKAIEGYERQVALHKQKIANPAQFAEDWERMSAQQQAGLIKHWQEDIDRNQALADVLRGLLQSR